MRQYRHASIIDPDPEDPVTWMAMRAAAIAALSTSGDRAAMRAYLAFVARHRGRAVAERARASILAAARAASINVSPPHATK